MARLVTLYSLQWGDLSLEEVCMEGTAKHPIQELFAKITIRSFRFLHIFGIKFTPFASATETRFFFHEKKPVNLADNYAGNENANENDYQKL